MATVSPRDFGAVCDGVADDALALQAAFDAAAGGRIALSGCSYAVTRTIAVASGTFVDGGGARIARSAGSGPVLASAAWLGRGPLRGNTVIRDLWLVGTSGREDHGLVLHDYFSRIENVEVDSAGGHGIVLASAPQGEAPGEGTLVENRIVGCIVREAGRSAFHLGEPGNGKLTDGLLRDCIAAQREGAREPSVVIGHLAGWIVDGLHTYGGAPDTAVILQNGYFASVSNLYVESWRDVALALHDVQTSVSVVGVHLLREQEGDGRFISVSAHGAFERPVVELGGLIFWNEAASPATALANEGGRVRLSSSGHAFGGRHAELLYRGDLPETAPSAPGLFTFSGAAARQFEIGRRRRGVAFAEAVSLAISARASDGGLATSFAATVHWTRSAADAASFADLVPAGPIEGFIAPPRLLLSHEQGWDVLRLAFTPAASGEGLLSCTRTL